MAKESKKQENKEQNKKEQPDTTPILVPTDFSDHSVEALVYAAGLARLMERPITVLHIVHDPASAPGYYRRDTEDGDDRTMDALAAEMMDTFLATARKKDPELDTDALDIQLLDGIPSKRIVEYANMVNAAMIVMGSHGHRGMKALVIASKAKKVIKYAPMPVTIVKAQNVRKTLTQERQDS